MKFPLFIATAFASQQELDRLYETHKGLNYERELFDALRYRASVKVPVALAIFEAYYKNFNFYKYLDEYTYEDKIFIFDGKSLFNEENHSYQNSDAWLSNLYRTNNLTYYGYREYDSKHHRKNWQHIDWRNGNSDPSSKLKNILKLDLSNAREPFEPKEKKISFEYDWQTNGRINWYSNYFTNTSDLNNRYNYINYGKQKSTPRSAQSLFNSWLGNKSCEEYSYLSSNNLRIYSLDEEGYDGICNGINIWGSSNWDFTSEHSRKWTTPYVAYRREKPRYWEDEYYYYSLGALQSYRGFSENYSQSREKKTLWNINYDDIFVIANNKDSSGKYSKLQISLNLKKIKNYTNFLKVSHLLSFNLNLSVNGKSKLIKFTLDDLMNNKNIFDLGLERPLEMPLFSDIYLTVSKREMTNNDRFELINKGAGNFKYKVNFSELAKNAQTVSLIEFSNEGLDKYYPSELLNKDKLKKFFYITNGKNKKSIIPDEIFNKLNPKIEFDDIRGSLKVKYHDIFNEIDSDGYADNMKIIPDPKDYNISSLDNVKQILKNKYSKDSSDYLWNSIDFVSKRSGDKDYEIVVKHTNPQVKAQWESFLKDADTYFSSKGDLSLIPLYSRYNPNTNYLPSNIGTLFRLNDNANKLGFTIDNYKFIVNKKSDQTMEVRASLNNEPEQVYLFGAKQNMHLDLAHYGALSEEMNIPEDENERAMFKYSMVVLGALLITSVSSLGALEIIKVLNRRKIL